MTQSVISKSIDIYHYPKEFEGNLGSVTLGDLHGNSVKLLHFLLRHDVVKFKDSVADPAKNYGEFVSLYTKVGIIVEDTIKSTIIANKALPLIKKHEETIKRYNELAEKKNRSDAEENEFNDINIDNVKLWYNEKVNQFQDAQSTIKKAQTKLKELDIVGQCNKLLEQFEVTDKDTLVRLIGDELADRGSCDYFTLRMLDFLHKNKVDVNITVSNHSIEFITAYENSFNSKNKELKPLGTISDSQKSSFVGLKMLVDQKIVTTDEISKIVNQSYKSSLKLIDYTLSETGINIITHAPAVFDIIKNTAESFKIPYDDSSKESLARTIDKINNRFSTMVQQNKVSELSPDLSTINIDHMNPKERAAHPFVYLIWNRWNEGKESDEARPAKHNGYDVTYTHGHDNFQSPLPQVINLDTECGKFIPQNIITAVRTGQNIPPSENLETYNVLNSDEKSVTLDTTSKAHSKKEAHVQGNKIAASNKTSSDSENKFTPDRPLIGLLATVGLIIGATIGIALVLSGVLAPLGAGILGALGLGLATGGVLSLIMGAVGLAASKTADNSLNNLPSEEVTLEQKEPSGCSVSLIGKKLNKGNDREIELEEVKSQSNQVTIAPNNEAREPKVSLKEQLSILRKNHAEVNNHEEHVLEVKTNP